MNSDYLIGIISYLPQDAKLRATRVKTHLKQLNQINDLYPDADVLQVSQQYEQEDAEACKAVLNNGQREANVDMYGKLGANGARNTILKQFYDSEYKFLMLLDDDSSLYPYYDAKNFMNDVCSYKYSDQLGLIRPLIPTMTPFKKSNYSQRSVVETHWILRSSVGLAPFGIFILNNLNRVFRKTPLFNENMNPANKEGYDDYDFILTLRELNVPSHTCNQIVANPLDAHSSVCVDGEEARKANHTENILQTYRNHPSLKIKYDVRNGRVKSDVTKLSTWPSVYVPRQHVYQFEESMIPKNASAKISVTKKKLF